MRFLVILATLVSFTRCDTPANCLFEDIEGSWTFYETARTGDASINCDTIGPVVYTLELELQFPNRATDGINNSGTWTMVYNQGFEVRIDERSYFAFSYYEGDYSRAVSYCNRTFNGWARDVTVRNWSCFRGEKNNQVERRVTHQRLPSDKSRLYKNDHNLINKINTSQRLWTATAYPQHEQYTLEEMLSRAGGPKTGRVQRPQPARPSEELKARASLLPRNFDWRNVKGVNYISPIRDQGKCGSCYAFASMANLEANLRIRTKNERQDIFSPQDPVSCSVLAQGCKGGFDFLIAGRYAMDQGVVAEECDPYTGNDRRCKTDPSCPRTYVSSYEHVGGYYGACSEEAMLETLATKGPISTSFEVYDDFYSYRGGIYYHTGFKSDFNPFEVTSHVVLIVAYGVDEETQEKYWTVKNSWGRTWGEEGFFRIRRGTDECAIESMAVVVTVIP